MFSSLFRTKKRRTHSQRPISRIFSTPSRRGQNAESAAGDDEEDEYSTGEYYDEEAIEDGDEDNDGEEDPLLPLFSAAHLDSLPVYALTHTIRLLIIQRCETTLSWDQLRSPQVSQFLVKPIQSEIRASHFSRATLYALIANNLQFNKESRRFPGNAGVLATRAAIAELLSVRLLKEFNTRELIDALSYDFDPLNGATPQTQTQTRGKFDQRPMRDHPHRERTARVSCLEVAIKAQAKRFLAHPLVVEHLEAIWAGTIVFHSAQDDLHRYPTKPRLSHLRHYGATHNRDAGNEEASVAPKDGQVAIRRSVTVYNPRHASIFKLSRLRVPRYRNMFSTMSFAVMLALFIAVLKERSRDITPLEILFWLWSIGYMLDELVGFSEQGFGLYILSVWNSFDIGILLFFLAYYILRLYGLAIADESKQVVAALAYDMLGASAVLLFPRLFSVLDHYRYFSQLLIAFRLMAQDLVAVFVLIVICCSGFFVAFTLSFASEENNGAIVVYDLFQILMGYTPAAWSKWEEYNVLGKIIMSIFLIVCHFVVVTILITVLTNSFMAIVKNSEEEHLFLFAVNAVSMVKSDALFSYVAPTNILGWIISPLRHFVPLQLFVKVNRTIIKATHFPILLSIFAYERLRMSKFDFANPSELNERRGRPSKRVSAFASHEGARVCYSPGARVREPSMMTVQKDEALAEVFRRPLRRDSIREGSTMAKVAENSNRRATVVDKWMTNLGKEGVASPPLDQPSSVVEQLETRRPRIRRSHTSQGLGLKYRDSFSISQSQLSEAEDVSPFRLESQSPWLFKRQSSASVDMEQSPIGLEDDNIGPMSNKDGGKAGTRDDDKDFLTIIPEQASLVGSFVEDIGAPAIQTSSDPSRTLGELVTESSSAQDQIRRVHDRNSSTNTIIFKPVQDRGDPSTLLGSKTDAKQPREQSPHARQGSPRRPAAQSRPMMPNKNSRRTVPNFAPTLENRPGFRKRTPSFDTIALGLASDIGDNRHVGGDDIGLMSGSLHQQMAFARSAAKQRESNEESSMVNRIMLARMNHLEEGFKDILREVKQLRNPAARADDRQEERDLVAKPVKRYDRKVKTTNVRTPAGQEEEASSAGHKPTPMQSEHDPFA